MLHLVDHGKRKKGKEWISKTDDINHTGHTALGFSALSHTPQTLYRYHFAQISWYILYTV